LPNKRLGLVGPRTPENLRWILIPMGARGWKPWVVKKLKVGREPPENREVGRGFQKNLPLSPEIGTPWLGI